MEIYVEEEVRAGRLPKGSFPLLREALLAGEFERGQVPALTAYKERMARNVLSRLLKLGLLVSSGPKSPVRLGFPISLWSAGFQLCTRLALTKILTDRTETARDDDAIEQLHDTLEMDPHFALARCFLGLALGKR